MDRGSRQATVDGVTSSQTWLKWLSMHTCTASFRPEKQSQKIHNYHLGIQSTAPKLDKTGGKLKIRWNLKEDKTLSGHWQGPPGTQGWHIPLTKATPQLLSEGEFSIQMFIRYQRHAKDIYQVRGWRTYPRAYPRIYTWTLTPGNSQGKCITMWSLSILRGHKIACWWWNQEGLQVTLEL